MNLRTLGLIALLAMLLFLTARVLADVKAERIRIKISDTCIEKVKEVAEAVDGVIETHWDEQTGELEIVFKQDETSLQKIEKAISEAGFDTPMYKAKEKAAEKLSEACKEEKSAGL